MRGLKGFLVVLLTLALASSAAAQGKRYITITNGAAGDTTAVGMADSSGVKSIGSARLVGIAFHSFATGSSSQTVSRWAIQLRWHKDGLSDSNSVFPIPVTGHGGWISATVDSPTVFGPALLAASKVLPSGDEFVWVTDRGASLNPAEWTPRRGNYIPIANFYGQPIDADAISIRWRHLGGPGVATTWIYLITQPK